MESTAHQLLEAARVAPRVRSCCAVMGERVKIPSGAGKYRSLSATWSGTLPHVKNIRSL